MFESVLIPLVYKILPLTWENLLNFIWLSLIPNFLMTIIWLSLIFNFLMTTAYIFTKKMSSVNTLFTSNAFFLCLNKSFDFSCPAAWPRLWWGRLEEVKIQQRTATRQAGCVWSWSTKSNTRCQILEGDPCGGRGISPGKMSVQRPGWERDVGST